MLLLVATILSALAQDARQVQEEPVARLDPGFILESLTVSDGMDRVAWVSRTARGMKVVVDGRPGVEYRSVALGTPIFSPGGDRVAFVAERSDGWRVVLDGSEGPTLEGVLEGSLSFGPQGLHVAYGVQALGYWWRPAVDKAPPPAGEDELFDQLGDIVLGKGGELAFSAKKDHRWFVARGEECGHAYDAVERVLFSPDGERFAYVAHAEHRQMAVVDGIPEEPWDEIDNQRASFSPDGARFAYPVRSGRSWHVVVDGNPGPSHMRLGFELQFGPEGRVGWTASDGDGWQIFVDGEPVASHHALVNDSLALGPSGRLAWAARTEDGGVIVFIDGVPGKRWDALVAPLAFSPDGEHVAWGAQLEASQFAVIDDEAGDSWPALVTIGGGRIVWDGPETIRYLAMRDGAIYRVTEKLGE